MKISILILVVLFKALPTIAVESVSDKTELPVKVIPFGLGFNIHIMSSDKDMDSIKASGVKFIRADFNWAKIERITGNYDLAPYDLLLNDLTKRGIRAIFILDYRNKLYPNPETTDEGREAYARFAAASVRHFKGRNVIWEIWNEPNVHFWKGTGNAFRTSLPCRSDV